MIKELIEILVLVERIEQGMLLIAVCLFMNILIGILNFLKK